MTRGPSDTGKAIDFAAAAAFAAGVAFAALVLAGGLVALLGAPTAFLLAFTGLRRIDADRGHALAAFALPPLDAPRDEPDETSDDNVVRLFDPRQLAIARPLAATPGGVPEDAGQALSDALAQLKRALRQ